MMCCPNSSGSVNFLNENGQRLIGLAVLILVGANQRKD